MSFADTYHAEVLQSRRDRSRKAFFWAKVVSFVLMITVAATLRADPNLRNMILQNGMDAVVSVADLRNPAVSTAALPLAPTGHLDTAVAEHSSLPTLRIKVNRPQPTGQNLDIQTLAESIGNAAAAQP